MEVLKFGATYMLSDSFYFKGPKFREFQYDF